MDEQDRTPEPETAAETPALTPDAEAPPAAEPGAAADVAAAEPVAAEEAVAAESLPEETAETATVSAGEPAAETTGEEAAEVEEPASEGEEEVADAEDAAEAAPAPVSESELLCGLQCVLFVAGEPLQVDRLAQALGQDVTQVPKLCDRLNEKLAGQGLHVVQLAGGFALATRPEFADYVQRLVEPEPERLSIQALETLAIVAYRQPITRPEIDQLRGVNSGGVVASLLEKGLVRIKGRKDAPGRPFMLETTPHFLSAFGLKDLTDLPRVDLPEIGQATDQTKILGEALEELTGGQEGETPSAD